MLKLQQNSTKSAKNITTLLIVVGFAVVFSLAVLAILSVPFFKSNAAGVTQNAGEVDLGGASQDWHEPVALFGTWDFFYNTWLVTDHVEGQQIAPTEASTLNHIWTTPARPREGIASYRMFLKNAPVGQTLSFQMADFFGGIKVFLNGEEYFSLGMMDRCRAATISSFRLLESKEYTVLNAEPIEVVVELSYTHDACVTEPLLLQVGTAKNASPMPFPIENIIFSILFAVFLVCAVIGVMTKRDLFFMILLILVVAQYVYEDSLQRVFILSLADKEMLKSILLGTAGFFVNTYEVAAKLVNILVVLAIFLCTYKYSGRKIYVGDTILVVACTLLYGISEAFLSGTWLQYLSVVALLAILARLVVLCAKSLVNHGKHAYTLLLLAAVISLNSVLFVLDESGALLELNSNVSHVSTTIVLVFVIILYFRRLRDSYQYVFKLMDTEREITNVKALALKKQITPHFVFNVMSTIQYLFHEDNAIGAEALQKFKKHLNLNIEASESALVPFQDEIVNIKNYFDLENMRFEGKFQLDFQVEYIDFEAPILCLQPLVENCIKHAHLQDVAGGKIVISSKKQGEVIVVSVMDNGCGFLPSKNKKTSVGLANVVERMKIMLGAEVKINSKIGVGTTVDILIPVQKEGAKC